MDDIEIINLPPEEWREFKEIRLEALLRDPQAFGASYENGLRRPDEYWESRLQDALSGEKNWMFFARSKGKIIGLAGAFLSEDPEVANVISVYVTQSARGRGISKMLMEALLEELSRAELVHTARLCVNKDQAAAVALYRSVGFTVVGEEECALGDGMMHSEWLMERPLKG